MTIFNEEVKEETAEALLGVLQGNHDAVMFCMELLYVYHYWDDQVDGDKRDPEDANTVFLILFDKFKRNPFYNHYRNELDVLIMSSILQWLDANELEKKGELSDLRKAYMLRAFIIQIWGYCAYLLGGIDYYRTINMQDLYEEDFDRYIGEFNA
jgi:hypothetical protein